MYVTSVSLLVLILHIPNQCLRFLRTQFWIKASTSVLYVRVYIGIKVS
uniref:Uncharacterized protein n=1 Tax=Anguilla anguilla TaxID=7936 RepID=A0A0E9SWD9_ANGAN